METDTLKSTILRLAASDLEGHAVEARAAVEALVDALTRGRVRAARREGGVWRAVEWVKSGILLAFRVGEVCEFPGGLSSFFDKNTLPLRDTRGVEENIRIVPGGSSVRAGAFLGENVVIMPPAFVNIGAHVGRAQ